MGDKMRREVDINVPHRQHLTEIMEATVYIYIGKGSIPRQIDLPSGESLNQRITVRVEHPVELDVMPKKMRSDSSEYTDVSRRRCPTKPHHNDLLLLAYCGSCTSGDKAPTDKHRMERPTGISIQPYRAGQQGEPEQSLSPQLGR